MDNKIKTFFENISGTLRNTPGTIDMIFTFGTSALSEKSTEWINYGISNMSEIYNSLKDIHDIVKKYANHGDLQESFFDDLFTILQDLSYHAAIFGIYFGSIEYFFQNELLKNNISNICHTSKVIEEDAPLHEKVLSKVTAAKSAFETVFLDETGDYSCKLLCLYDLQRSLLSLQIIACDQKKAWWLKKEC